VGFPDGDQVKEDKLILWLEEVVLAKRIKKRKRGGTRGKGKKPKGRRQQTINNPSAHPTGDGPLEADAEGESESESGAQDGEEGEEDPANEGEAGPGQENDEDLQPLLWRSIEGYISAVMDLYRQQVSQKEHTNPNPRGPALEGRIDAIRRGERQKRKDHYVDRQLGSLVDGYNTEEMRRVCEVLRQQVRQPEQHLRTLLDFLLGHFLLARGELRRMMQLPDFFAVPFEDEGPTKCLGVIAVFSQAKQNQHGKIDYMGMVRNKDVLVCPVGALAAYFFWRWHFSDERFPTFNRNQDWYDIQLLIGRRDDLSKEFSYGTQLEWIRRTFQLANVSTSMQTHAMRGCGARMAELKGVSECQVSHWSRYLTHSC
jgi:hypothetical protein